jgi:hypothetical protein
MESDRGQRGEDRGQEESSDSAHEMKVHDRSVRAFLLPSVLRLLSFALWPLSFFICGHLRHLRAMAFSQIPLIYHLAFVLYHLPV